MLDGDEARCAVHGELREVEHRWRVSTADMCASAASWRRAWVLRAAVCGLKRSGLWPQGAHVRRRHGGQKNGGSGCGER